MKKIPDSNLSTNKFQRLLKVTSAMSVSTVIAACMIIQKVCNSIFIKTNHKWITIAIGCSIYIAALLFIDRFIKASVKIHNDELIKESEELADAITDLKLADSDQLQKLLEILVEYRNQKQK